MQERRKSLINSRHFVSSVFSHITLWVQAKIKSVHGPNRSISGRAPPMKFSKQCTTRDVAMLPVKKLYRKRGFIYIYIYKVSFVDMQLHKGGLHFGERINIGVIRIMVVNI